MPTKKASRVRSCALPFILSVEMSGSAATALPVDDVPRPTSRHVTFSASTIHHHRHHHLEHHMEATAVSSSHRSSFFSRWRRRSSTLWHRSSSSSSEPVATKKSFEKRASVRTFKGEAVSILRDIFFLIILRVLLVVLLVASCVGCVGLALLVYQHPGVLAKLSFCS